MSRKAKRNHLHPGHREPHSEPAPKRSRFGRLGSVVVIVAAVLVALGLGTLLFKSKGTSSGQVADTSNEAALASSQAPTLGDAHARVHIVEFLDPACECGGHANVNGDYTDREQGLQRIVNSASARS